MCVDVWDAAQKVLDAAAGDTEDMLNNILENIEVVLNVCFQIGNFNLQCNSTNTTSFLLVYSPIVLC